ncbi:LAG1 longevity assurance 3-like protein isoform X2 [Cinnamomum micranthum f. kanehirae]|uniref:LAG1 longevity assurance 3-like protein isoform X2 n=1 Tax=Cinnamomum micranthum f. kanehirae TaxID=337451 RepID=A0A3S3NCM9_9MAGN|nr:LAG1 longevity assurance 3-like protein isoform X2 [Cinnamomum micranthum f. kanehirae]
MTGFLMSRLKLKGLYMYAAGFYTYSIFALIFWETRRSDFGVSMGHHVATLILIVLSYIFRFARAGSIVLALHDASDVFLETGKMSKYSGYEWFASFSFIIFVASWMILRLTYYPFWILRSTRNRPYEEGLDCRLWALSNDGTFSVASFFLLSLEGSNETSLFHTLWKFKVPPRVAAFASTCWMSASAAAASSSRELSYVTEPSSLLSFQARTRRSVKIWSERAGYHESTKMTVHLPVEAEDSTISHFSKSSGGPSLKELDAMNQHPTSTGTISSGHSPAVYVDLRRGEQFGILRRLLPAPETSDEREMCHGSTKIKKRERGEEKKTKKKKKKGEGRRRRKKEEGKRREGRRKEEGLLAATVCHCSLQVLLPLLVLPAVAAGDAYTLLLVTPASDAATADAAGAATAAGSDSESEDEHAD